jgi:GT2 family glycosyltransferase
VLHHEIEKQWSTFGAGNSFIHMNSLNSIRFNLAYEHGYGEDADFGMQLRNAGIDIIYVPNPTILHLKAPMGGFRTKFKQPWVTDAIQPKPSPTVMLFRLLHQTKIQLKGYQLRLIINMFKQRKPVRIITFVKDFRKSWANSLKWAAYLKSL